MVSTVDSVTHGRSGGTAAELEIDTAASPVEPVELVPPTGNPEAQHHMEAQAVSSATSDGPAATGESATHAVSDLL